MMTESFTSDDEYTTAKLLFMKLFLKANTICESAIQNKRDEERNWSFSYIPAIQPHIQALAKSKKIVTSELEYIEASQQTPLARLYQLRQYIDGVTELRFNGLFMIILCAKLKKHFMTSHIYEEAQRICYEPSLGFFKPAMQEPNNTLETTPTCSTLQI